MKILIEDIRNKFAEKGLKITPQRVVILEAIYKLNNHPTAENIIEYIRESHPNIATGTVYKVLETLVENGLIKKVRNSYKYYLTTIGKEAILLGEKLITMVLIPQLNYCKI